MYSRQKLGQIATGPVVRARPKPISSSVVTANQIDGLAAANVMAPAMSLKDRVRPSINAVSNLTGGGLMVNMYGWVKEATGSYALALMLLAVLSFSAWRPCCT